MVILGAARIVTLGFARFRTAPAGGVDVLLAR
jgi:hypothetical protein